MLRALEVNRVQSGHPPLFNPTAEPLYQKDENRTPLGMDAWE